MAFTSIGVTTAGHVATVEIQRPPNNFFDVALIREITSAPKGCCLLSIEATPTGVPVTRSSRVATTVVVPRSKAMA